MWWWPLWICCSPLSNPSLWLLLCPSLPLLLSSSLSLSQWWGPGGPEERERAGAVGNKCLIIRLIIIPGGSESGRWRKGGEQTYCHCLSIRTPWSSHIHKCTHTVFVRQTNTGQAKLLLCRLMRCFFVSAVTPSENKLHVNIFMERGFQILLCASQTGVCIEKNQSRFVSRVCVQCIKV